MISIPAPSIRNYVARTRPLRYGHGTRIRGKLKYTRYVCLIRMSDMFQTQDDSMTGVCAYPTEVSRYYPLHIFFNGCKYEADSDMQLTLLLQMQMQNTFYHILLNEEIFVSSEFIYLFNLTDSQYIGLCC